MNKSILLLAYEFEVIRIPIYQFIRFHLSLNVNFYNYNSKYFLLQCKLLAAAIFE